MKMVITEWFSSFWKAVIVDGDIVYVADERILDMIKENVKTGVYIFDSNQRNRLIRLPEQPIGLLFSKKHLRTVDNLMDVPVLRAEYPDHKFVLVDQG